MLYSEKTYLYKPTIGSSHTWALNNLKELPVDAKILDFGAGSGVIGEKLLSDGYHNIYSVEIDPNRRTALSNTYLKCAENLEELNESNFDCIILLDILEHLTNPFEFYLQLTARLSPKGVVIISLPNIAHWSIRLSLLFGFFEYTERGLIDKTHFNFFNKKRALKLATSDDSLELKSYSASTSPAEFVLPKAITQTKIYKFLDLVRLKIANLFPALFGYQHLIKLQKKQ